MAASPAFVEETRFGNWFLKSATWRVHVLRRALDDLQRLMPAPAPRVRKVMDVGCGFGHSFDEIAARFAPDVIVGMDADPGLDERAQAAASQCACEVRLLAGNAARMAAVPDGEFDLLLCHQTFHHIVEQEAAMAEFFRVLRPGGMLLFAESTRRYIHSLPIRLLFRHPMDVQRTAGEYIAMVRAAGFDVPDARISMPYLWWSRPDLGFLEWIGRPVPREREETLVNLVATRPRAG
ncbi:SAM-dependent methyltransferase [Paracidovorax avenae]|uniref:class I SAM-dependent methyltransferase n=1 Tax=Paracidovorax avenae TaxID=80867 RepID=UPI000D16F6BF|nr:class I SAM-dependent methyltransferase [Paracidovorax avenae]AVS77404.1 SAM-dependent methyltransferase [Paracidovorax avenae]AVT19719.1 SAM-dependent methyltransferase [Paracidovorax avenae]